jgi:uncharacterized membrane protein
MQDRQTLCLSSRPPRFYGGWALAVGLTALLMGLAVAPPVLGPELREAVMHAFAPLCHQLPSRSPHVDGVQLAACHRCLSIYGGLLAASLAFGVLWRWEPWLGRHAKYLLLLALLPVGIDWGGHVLGLWVNTPLSRALTGSVLGLIVGLYFARAMVQAVAPSMPSGASEAVVSG